MPRAAPPESASPIRGLACLLRSGMSHTLAPDFGLCEADYSGCGVLKQALNGIQHHDFRALAGGIQKGVGIRFDFSFRKGSVDLAASFLECRYDLTG